MNQEIILIDSAHAFLKYNGSIPDYLRYFEIGFPQELAKKIHTSTQRALFSLNEKDLFGLIPLRGAEERQTLQFRWMKIKQVSTLKEMINLYRGAKR